jgi:hypothetical protein
MDTIDHPKNQKTMTPKEKANELYFAFLKVLPDVVEIDKDTLKNCSLLVINEILINMIFFHADNKSFNEINKRRYWEEVKKEIEQL